MRYAEKTTVSSEGSRNEIERILVRYQASKFMYGWENQAAVIMFEMAGRRIKFVLPLPDRNSSEFTRTPARGRMRDQRAALAAYDQAVRQKWRSLALVIKAKLEAVESGITVFDEEFLAHIVLPNNTTVGDWVTPQIDAAYQSGRMPKLLPETT